MIDKKSLSIITIFFLLMGCLEYETPTKQYYKRIQTQKYEVNWFFKSLITNKPPDIVEVLIDQESIEICQSDNILNVKMLGFDTINIKFCGEPSMYGKSVMVPSSVGYITVVVDTTGKCDPNKRSIPSFTGK